jgi:acyl-CoA thioesterase
MISPENVVATMWAKDYFSQWLGLEILKVDIGYCKLQFKIRKEMLNGHGTVQGGVLFSAADSAFAFACNAQGKLTVALEVSINFTKPAFENDLIIIEAQSLHHGYKTGVYDVKVYNEKSELIAVFKGTCYTSSKNVIE